MYKINNTTCMYNVAYYMYGDKKPPKHFKEFKLVD